MRMVHEAQLHDNNCFITLTYDSAHLPENGELVVGHYQKFMKRLRRQYPETKIRFYHCGEYGENNFRPHYHACLFNFDFVDKTLWKKIGDNNLYISQVLEKTWGKGFATVGNLTFKSAAYAARYVTKKKTGPQKEAHYERINRNTGEVVQLPPEYSTMSRRPGIGLGFFKQFKDEIYPDDFVVLNNKKMQPPKYYDRQFEVANEQVFEEIKEKRVISAVKFREEQTYNRRMIREKVAKAKASMLKRTIEEM